MHMPPDALASAVSWRVLWRSLAALFMDKPRTVHKSTSATWYVFTDARYKPEEGSNKAGFGGAL